MDEIRFSVELRDDEQRGPGRLSGRLIRYGERARDRPELFEPGALRWPSDGIVLNRQHERRSPILRFTPVVEGDEVRIDATLPDTQAGRDAAAEIRSGLFRGLSMEFKAVRERFAGGVRRIAEAVLGGAGLVDNPSYATTVEIRKTKPAGGDLRRWVY